MNENQEISSESLSIMDQMTRLKQLLGVVGSAFVVFGTTIEMLRQELTSLLESLIVLDAESKEILSP